MKTDIRKTISRKDQAEETKMHLLNTALNVFSARGYSQTSIKDLAKEAEVSQGLLYHYFSSKEDLLMAAIEYHSFIPQLRQILCDTRERPFREILHIIAVKFLVLLEDKSELLQIFMQESQTNPEIKKAWEKLLVEGTTLLQKFIRSRIDSGEIRKHNVEATSYSLFSSLVMFHFTGEVFGIFRIPADEFIDTVLDNLIYGIEQNN